MLENETEPNKIFTLSFWETKKNAEYYEKEWYPKVKAMVETFFANPPLVRYHKLEETFSERLFTTTWCKFCRCHQFAPADAMFAGVSFFHWWIILSGNQHLCLATIQNAPGAVHTQEFADIRI